MRKKKNEEVNEVKEVEVSEKTMIKEWMKDFRYSSSRFIKEVKDLENKKEWFDKFTQMLIEFTNNVNAMTNEISFYSHYANLSPEEKQKLIEFLSK